MSAFPSKVYALVDCNSFFCSCERLFRPDLNNKPVGVLSNNDGCFVSRTPELKALGVKMAQPYFQVKDLCRKNNVAVFSSNFTLYTNMSQRVMSVLAEMSPLVEVYSVDEAFLDLTGIKDVEAYALQIKKEVYKRVGIPVSVGLGPTKTLAKVANNWAKEHTHTQGVMSLLTQDVQNEVLKDFPVGDVWGVGYASNIKMKSLNIYTAKDFRDYPNTKQIQKIFTKVGLQRQEELKGQARFELETIPIPRQGITCSRSFGSPILGIDELKESVAHYASYACEKLRRQGSVTQSLKISIRSSRYIAFEQQFKASEVMRLETATADTRKVIRYALRAVDKLYQAGYSYKKAGIDLFGITSKNQQQMSLLEQSDSLKSQKLMQALDIINAKEGTGTVAAAICFSTPKKWRMSRELQSPRYVSGWTELRKVK